MEGDRKRERLLERYGRSYTGGQMVFVEDEPATEVFMVVEGRIRLIKKVRLVERDIEVLKAGDICGETALVPGGCHPSSAVALGDCHVLALPGDDFKSLLREQPDVALKLTHQLIRRLQSSEERIENMMLRDSQSKIVNTLIRLAQSTQETDGRLLIAISPIELSSRIGLDVDSVKRGILELRENNYLRIIDEKIEIFDLEGLRKLYQLMGMKEELRRG
ncbi:MAG: Crp/Fnr family transcriptional regulator [Myxococcota bacterium]|jgi:CRP-like cAMP-binding protein|nr:Crp/Fnr family transcriptional regulator [Myxococcota bacterium]